MKVQRRRFLQGCCAGILAMDHATVGNLVFGQPGGGPSGDILISIFLRGGMDALSLLVPHGDPDYHIARARLAMDTSDVLDINGLLGLHPSAVKLKELLDSRHLGIVMACGSTDPTRSHFDAQDYMERGKPGDSYFLGGGWLARHLAMFPSDAIFQGVSLGSTVAVSLEGFSDALAMDDPGDFTLRGSGSQEDDIRRALRQMYQADPVLGTVGQRTLDAADIVEAADPGNYVPGHGVTYPNSEMANAMAAVAQMIRLDLGLQAATVDIGGWDTHESQADWGSPASGYFAGQIEDLSDALYAFWNDLSDFHGRITLVVASEFGRRLKENDNRGTDHGHAGVMLVLSANLIGNGLYGSWPGLSSGQLFEGVDLQVTTDFRTPLTEILVDRCQSPNIGAIFPGFTDPTRLGLFRANAVERSLWADYR